MVGKIDMEFFVQGVHRIRSFASVPGFTRKCGIMEIKLFEVSNNTGRCNRVLLHPIRTTLETRSPKIQLFREPDFQGKYEKDQ